MEPVTNSPRQPQHHVAHHVLLTNSLTPWFRTRVDVMHDTLVLDAPRTVLGIVPLGRARVAVPMSDVRGAEVGWQLRPERLLAAVVAAAIATVLEPPASIVALVIAGWLLILSWISVLRIRTIGGTRVAPICVLARGLARRVAARVGWIAERTS